MKSRHMIASLPLLALTICAQTVPNPQLPDRPATAVTRYKDAWVPVVGAEGASPVASANGRKVTLEANAGIALSVGDHYGPGFVTITDVQSTDVPPVNDAEQAATQSSFKATAETVDAVLVPDIDIPAAYAILVGTPPNEKPDASPSLAVKVWLIGDLTAGKKKGLSVKLPKLGHTEGTEWSILVFSNGRQVRSTGMGDVLPAYFDKVESMSLKRRLADRLAAHADAQVAVFRQMSLGLPPAVTDKYKGTTVKAEIKIGTDGRVTSAAPVDVTDPDLSDAIAKGFANWLFLPPVKNGAAIPATVIIPLKM